MRRICLGASRFEPVSRVHNRTVIVLEQWESVKRKMGLIRLGHIPVMRLAGSRFTFIPERIYMREALTVGERIRNRRKELGISQEQLACRIYTKKSTISKYENGKINISVDALAMMADVLDTTPNYLLRGDDVDELWLDDMTKILAAITDTRMRSMVRRQLQAVADLASYY